MPEPDPLVRSFSLLNAETDGDTRGNARKTAGSYHTPNSLVHELIGSAHDPVSEARLTADSSPCLKPLGPHFSSSRPA